MCDENGYKLPFCELSQYLFDEICRKNNIVLLFTNRLQIQIRTKGKLELN